MKNKNKPRVSDQNGISLQCHDIQWRYTIPAGNPETEPVRRQITSTQTQHTEHAYFCLRRKCRTCRRCSSVCCGHRTERVHIFFVCSDITPHVCQTQKQKDQFAPNETDILLLFLDSLTYKQHATWMSGMDRSTQFYVLSHWDRSSRSKLFFSPSHSTSRPGQPSQADNQFLSHWYDLIRESEIQSQSLPLSRQMWDSIPMSPTLQADVRFNPSVSHSPGRCEIQSQSLPLSRQMWDSIPKSPTLQADVRFNPKVSHSPGRCEIQYQSLPLSRQMWDSIPKSPTLQADVRFNPKVSHSPGRCEIQSQSLPLSRQM